MFRFGNESFFPAIGLILVLGLALLWPGLDAVAQESPTSVKIGILAKRGPERCLEKWVPMAAYLTNEIPGYSFSIVPLGYDKIIPAAERKEVGFILANPFFYVELEQSFGANRIVTLINKDYGEERTVYGGVIFHKADRKDIERLADLAGKTFMAVNNNSFGGWLAGWWELKEYGIDPHRDFADLRFGGTHDTVVYAVRDGEVDAGTVRTDTLERMVEEGKIRLEEFGVIHKHGDDDVKFPLLHSTRLYPEWPMAKLGHTPYDLAKKVAAALQRIPSDSPAARAAKCAGWTIPLNYQPVRECLKALRVGPYKDFGKVTPGAVLRQYWHWLVSALLLVACGALVMMRRGLAKRKQAEEKISHLNLMLRAIRNVNQLITQEKDRNKLLKGACECLIENRGDYTAWIAILDESGMFTTHAEAGLGEKFRPLVKEMTSGKFPACVKKALGRSGVVVTDDPDFCAGCPVLAAYPDSGCLCVRLEHHERICGVLSISMETDSIRDAKEQHLLKEVADDIALALHSIKLDENHRRAEEALRESEAKYRLLAENVTDVIWTMDLDMRFTYLSPSVFQLGGYTVEEAAALQLEQLLTPDSYKLAMDAFAKTMASEESREQNPSLLVKLDLEQYRKDGSTIWTEVGMTLLRDSEGAATEILGVTRDITDRKRAEEALRESEEKFRTIGASALDAIIMMDPEGCVAYWNAAAERMFGYTSDEINGKNVHEIIIPESYLDRFHEGFEAFKRTGEGNAIGKVFELTAKRKNGPDFPIEIALSSFRINEQYWASAIIRDITDRKQAEEEKAALEFQVRHQQKLESIGTLASGVAHEINNPVTAILNFAELIRMRTKDDERLADYTGRIISETYRVSDIVKNLLSFARQEKTSHSPALLADIINDTLSLVAAVFRKDQINVAVDVPDDLPKVKCRSQHIQQVLMNLFTNARDALNERYPEFDDNKALKITCAPFEKESVKWIRTTVENHGAPIPPEIMDRMFDPFFTTKPKDVGTGLGLSISYGIVLEHKGILSVESDESSTKFHMDLRVNNGWNLGDNSDNK